MLGRGALNPNATGATVNQNPMRYSTSFNPAQDLAGAPGISQAMSQENEQMHQNQVQGLPPWYSPQRFSFSNTSAPTGNSGGGNEGGAY